MTGVLLGAAAAGSDPWRWQPHVEVWVLAAGLGVLAWYAVTRVGRRAVRPGEPVLTRSQLVWGAAALVLLVAASDWPVHDLAEEYLYSVHMAQHLTLSFLVPAMALLATPTWLARLVVGSGRGYRVVRTLSRPVPATLLFNGVVVLTHVPWVVNASASNGALHYGLHVLLVSASLLMWLPVCGPLPELRFPLPTQMVYLFLQSIIPTIPAGWLTFAEGVVYETYDVVPRVFGLSVTHDQQIAGLLMKLGGGFFLWTLIVVLFIRFATRHMEDDRARGVVLDRRAPEADVLTWAQVERELQTAGPAPQEPSTTD